MRHGEDKISSRFSRFIGNCVIRKDYKKTVERTGNVGYNTIWRKRRHKEKWKHKGVVGTFTV